MFIGLYVLASGSSWAMFSSAVPVRTRSGCAPVMTALRRADELGVTIKLLPSCAPIGPRNSHQLVGRSQLGADSLQSRWIHPGRQVVASRYHHRTPPVAQSTTLRYRLTRRPTRQMRQHHPSDVRSSPEHQPCLRVEHCRSCCWSYSLPPPRVVQLLPRAEVMTVMVANELRAKEDISPTPAAPSGAGCVETACRLHPVSPEVGKSPCDRRASFMVCELTISKWRPNFCSISSCHSRRGPAGQTMIAVRAR